MNLFPTLDSGYSEIQHTREWVLYYLAITNIINIWVRLLHYLSLKHANFELSSWCLSNLMNQKVE